MDFALTDRHVAMACSIAAGEITVAPGMTGFEDLHPIHEDLWRNGLVEVFRPTPLRGAPIRDDYWRLTRAGELWLAEQKEN